MAHYSIGPRAEAVAELFNNSHSITLLRTNSEAGLKLAPLPGYTSSICISTLGGRSLCLIDPERLPAGLPQKLRYTCAHSQVAARPQNHPENFPLLPEPTHLPTRTRSTEARPDKHMTMSPLMPDKGMTTKLTS